MMTTTMRANIRISMIIKKITTRMVTAITSIREVTNMAMGDMAAMRAMTIQATMK